MQINVHQAKSQLSQLLVAVENGEEVIIARNGVPVAKMVPAKKRGGMILGLLEKEGKGVVTPDNATLAALDREIEQMFYDSGEIVPATLVSTVQEPRAAFQYSAGRTSSATSVAASNDDVKSPKTPKAPKAPKAPTAPKAKSTNRSQRK